MIRLDSGVRAMLERNHFYNFSGYSLTDGFVSFVEIIPLRDYQFFLPECFSIRDENNLKYFKSTVEYFIQNYLFGWARKKKETTKDFDCLNFGEEVVSFFYNFKPEEVFKRIESGKDYSEFEVTPNNTVFKIKRFGNILGCGIKSVAGNHHKSGIAAILKMCRCENYDNNQGVYELIDAIKVSVSLKSISPDGSFGGDFRANVRSLLRGADLSAFEPT